MANHRPRFLGLFFKRICCESWYTKKKELLNDEQGHVFDPPLEQHHHVGSGSPYLCFHFVCVVDFVVDDENGHDYPVCDRRFVLSALGAALLRAVRVATKKDLRDRHQT